MFSLQNREKKQILFTEKLEPKKVWQFLLIDAQTLKKVKEEPLMHIQLCALRDYTESLKLITSVVFLLVITVTEDIKHNIVLSAVVRYLWLKSLSPQELHKDMVTSVGDSVYFYITVKTWTRRESVEGDPVLSLQSPQKEHHASKPVFQLTMSRDAQWPKNTEAEHGWREAANQRSCNISRIRSVVAAAGGVGVDDLSVCSKSLPVAQITWRRALSLDRLLWVQSC